MGATSSGPWLNSVIGISLTVNAWLDRFPITAWITICITARLLSPRTTRNDVSTTANAWSVDAWLNDISTVDANDATGYVDATTGSG